MQYHRTPPPDQPNSTTLGRGAAQAVRYLAFPSVVTMFLWLTGTGTATLLQSVLAYLLLQFSWTYWVSWKAKPVAEKDFPLFTVIAGMYWLAYGLPLFWSSPDAWLFRSTRPMTNSSMTRALALALLALASMFLGMRLGVFRWLRRASKLDLRDTPVSPKYVAAVLLVTLALNYSWVMYRVGSGLRQVLVILCSTVPLAAFAILLKRRLLRPVPRFERAVLVIFIGVTLGFGLASGSIGAGASIIITAGCVLADTRFRIPKIALAFVLVYVIFLQPAKQQFRATYWGAEAQSTRTERAMDWFSMSLRRWEGTFSDSNPAAFRDTLYSSVARFSLLQQTANVMEITPNMIPYQGVFMYRYMAVTLIPRALWPDKPTVNEANRFYQVTYGLTSERNLDGVSISVGMAAESYIAYGWLGTIGIMMLVGILLDGIATVCLARNSGVLMKGIGLALMPGLVNVEAQMAQYLGGLLQQALVTIAVMLPVVEIRRRVQFRRPPLGRPMRLPAQARRIPGAVGSPQVTR